MEYEELLRNVLLIMKEKGISQTDIGDKIGLDGGKLSDRLSDKHRVKIKVKEFFDLANALKVDVREFFLRGYDVNMVNEAPAIYEKRNEKYELCMQQLRNYQNIVNDLLLIIKSCKNEKGNFNADADSNNISNEPGAR